LVLQEFLKFGIGFAKEVEIVIYTYETMAILVMPAFKIILFKKKLKLI